ncbi:MAG: hypothetical protein ACR2GP_09675 [Burkholderiaceae bacterium]
MAPNQLALNNIQGNILGGFNKDFQTFIFLKFKSAAGGRAWIKEISDADNEVGIAKSSSKHVLCERTLSTRARPAIHSRQTFRDDQRRRIFLRAFDRYFTKDRCKYDLIGNRRISIGIVWTHDQFDAE